MWYTCLERWFSGTIWQSEKGYPTINPKKWVKLERKRSSFSGE